MERPWAPRMLQKPAMSTWPFDTTNFSLGWTGPVGSTGSFDFVMLVSFASPTHMTPDAIRLLQCCFSAKGSNLVLEIPTLSSEVKVPLIWLYLLMRVTPSGRLMFSAHITPTNLGHYIAADSDHISSTLNSWATTDLQRYDAIGPVERLHTRLVGRLYNRSLQDMIAVTWQKWSEAVIFQMKGDVARQFAISNPSVGNAVDLNIQIVKFPKSADNLWLVSNSLRYQVAKQLSDNQTKANLVIAYQFQGNLTTTGRGLGRTPPVALSSEQVQTLAEALQNTSFEGEASIDIPCGLQTQLLVDSSGQVAAMGTHTSLS
ncbi:pldh-t, partial [Symbiodinium sp. KB8]